MPDLMKEWVEKYPENFTGEVIKTVPITPEQIEASRAYLGELETLAAPLVNWIRENHGYHTEVLVSADHVCVKHDGAGIPFPFTEK